MLAPTRSSAWRLALLLFWCTAVSGMSTGYKFRNVRAADLRNVACLCAESFEGPFAWHEALKKGKYEREFEEQLKDRQSRLVEGGVKHAMFLAENDEGTVCAFLELGLLPSPVVVKTVWEGEEVESRPEVPFLGNVAVAPDSRRAGLGTKLIKLGEKVAQKWGDDTLFVAVEASNIPALQMYKKLSFEVVLDERDNINRRGSRLFLRRQLPPSSTSEQNSQVSEG